MGEWQMTIEYTPTTPVSTVCSGEIMAWDFEPQLFYESNYAMFMQRSAENPSIRKCRVSSQSVSFPFSDLSSRFALHCFQHLSIYILKNN